MKQKTIKEELPKLVQGSSSYKLIVPENVEEKIRYLIRKFPATEWSGVLFYTYQGSFETDNLVLTCQDLYPMDLGSSGWTEFHMNEDVSAYMAENIELFDCELGLIHSHHTLGAFFSGQDKQMLAQEGDDTNCFLSLVVDTKGEYVAAITRKIQTKSEITIKNLGKSYEFFGEGSKEIPTESTSETTKVIDKEVIEYFNLDVERHEVSNPLGYLDSRFEEITSKKKLPFSTSKDFNFTTNYYNPFKKDSAWPPHNEKNAQLSLFPKEEIQIEEPSAEDLMNWVPNKKMIKQAVTRMLLCSLIVSYDKVDLDVWTKRHMEDTYERIFGEDPTKTFEFEQWRDYIIDRTLQYFPDVTTPIPDEDKGEDDSMIFSILANALIEELNNYLGNCCYVSSYIDALSTYL